MSNFAHKSTMFFVGVCLWLITAPVFGAGLRGRDLTKAGNFINEKKHDEAILALTDYIRRNPDCFDNAQKRLRRIQSVL